MMNSIIIPDHVDAIVKELSQDLSTHEIWLIGSRATGNYNVSSDWDLLLFSNEEPVPRERRCEGVDVLHCGPSGVILLEGQSAWMESASKTSGGRRLMKQQLSIKANASLMFLLVWSGTATSPILPSLTRKGSYFGQDSRCSTFLTRQVGMNP